MPDWLLVLLNTFELMNEFHSPDKAGALAAHHTVVLRLAARFNWELAVKYNIGRREKIRRRSTLQLFHAQCQLYWYHYQLDHF